MVFYNHQRFLIISRSQFLILLLCERLVAEGDLTSGSPLLRQRNGSRRGSQGLSLESHQVPPICNYPRICWKKEGARHGQTLKMIEDHEEKALDVLNRAFIPVKTRFTGNIIGPVPPYNYDYSIYMERNFVNYNKS